MDAERRANFRAALTTFTLCLIVALLLIWFIQAPRTRQYPDREPVYFWHMWTADWKVLVEEICQGFNESQTTYEVIPLSIPRRVADSKFLLSSVGGAPPDCMAQWNQVVPQLAERGILRPFDELMTAEEKQSFINDSYPVVHKVAYYQNRIYCMPLDLNIRACYYRLDHLRRSGLISRKTPRVIRTSEQYEELSQLLPKTLEELEVWGEQLHKFDRKGRLLRVGFMPSRLLHYASTFGNGFYDWDKQELTLNTPDNMRALTYLVEQRRAVGIDRMHRFESSSGGNFGADWPFISGKKSISLDGQWRVRQLEKFGPDIPYTVAPLPPPESGGRANAGWVYSNFMIIPTSAKNPEGAWAFIKYWMGTDTPEKAAEFYARSGWLPPRPQVTESATYQDFIDKHPPFKTFTDLLTSPALEPMPPVPFQLLLFDRIKRADDSAQRGTLTPARALEKLDEEIQAEINRREAR